MINLWSFGDPERWAIIVFISIGLYFLWTNRHTGYDRTTKWLLTIPRLYLILYEVLIITDIYNTVAGFTDLIKTGIGGVYGLILLFGVEAYVRWTNKKYGRN